MILAAFALAGAVPVARGVPTDWYRVRSGSGTSSRGDKLSIYGADPTSAFESQRYSRLSIRTTGFTGIKFNRIDLSGGRTITTKDYTGYVENGSAEGRKDAQTILAACTPK